MVIWFFSTLVIINFSFSWSYYQYPNTIGFNYSGNKTHNVCFKDEKLEKKDLNKLNSETKVIELMKNRFKDKTNKENLFRNNYLDNPNSQQTILSRALIENSNYVFDKMYDMDPSFVKEKSTSALMKYPRFKFDTSKGIIIPPRIKRNYPGFEAESIDYIDDTREEKEINIKHKKKKSKQRDDPEMRVHCVRSGLNEVVCKHDNFSFCFKLPQELFKKDIMEKLVSSVCSIVDEAIPEGTANQRQLVDIAVSKIQPKIKGDKVGESYLNKKFEKDPSKVIRINIPIDFSGIPFNNEENEDKVSDNIDSPIEDNMLEADQDNYVIPTERNKYKQYKLEDNYINLLQQNKENVPHRRIDNQDNYSNRSDIQGKWLNRRENLKNQMVSSPSLIILKRNTSNVQELEEEQNRRTCKKERYKEFCLKKHMNKICPL